MAIASNRRNTPSRTIRVAVAGNPNSGKTTLFNSLTGLHHKVGNYSGVTVEKREGTLRGHRHIQLLDLPGIYSLSAQSPDEQVAQEVLLGASSDSPRPDLVLIVVDATNLDRNLYLATQIIEMGIPALIACNMMDRLHANGYHLDTERLARRLGVGVLPTVGSRREGVEQLQETLAAMARKPLLPIRRRWSPGEPLESAIQELAGDIHATQLIPETAAEGMAALLLASPPKVQQTLPAPLLTAVERAAVRLAEQGIADAVMAMTAARYTWIEQVVHVCLARPRSRVVSTTDRLDRVLTHRIWGPLSFVAVMFSTLFGMFVIAAPLTEHIAEGVRWLQQTVSGWPAGPLRDLLRDGVIAGVGNVLTFFPQIVLLFLFIALLEDSGYMARAAFVMDRFMSKVGLPGKSFIPLLSCHACTVPGVMATRMIEDRKDRLATIVAAPFMTCSARLPVYTALIAACLPVSAWSKAGLLIGLYVFGILAGTAMAALFKRTIIRNPPPTFLMEMPAYRLPMPGSVARSVWDRTWAFLARAGTVILALTIVIWTLSQYPRDAAARTDYQTARQYLTASGLADDSPEVMQVEHQYESQVLRHSVIGRLGQGIEPVLRPLGFDWRIGIGLISSFASREVFVGTMGVLHSGGSVHEREMTLPERLRTATWPDGSLVFTPAAAIALIVFYALSCQCISTIAVIRQETGTWRWPIFIFSYMLVLAYLAALLVYQGSYFFGR